LNPRTLKDRITHYLILSPACPKANVLTLARLDYSSKRLGIRGEI